MIKAYFTLNALIKEKKRVHDIAELKGQIKAVNQLALLKINLLTITHEYMQFVSTVYSHILSCIVLNL